MTAFMHQFFTLKKSVFMAKLLVVQTLFQLTLNRPMLCVLYEKTLNIVNQTFLSFMWPHLSLFIPVCLPGTDAKRRTLCEKVYFILDR